MPEKISTEEIVNEGEEAEVVKDTPLEIEEFVDITKNESQYPNTEYYWSYEFVGEDDELKVFNSSSKRLKALLNELMEQHGELEDIPAGTLETEGEGFDKQFIWTYRD